MFQDYFIDATLLYSQLIVLNKFSANSENLGSGKNINVKLMDGQDEYLFESCHIDNTVNRRLRLPLEIIVWIKNTFSFSTAYFSVHESKGAGDWTKADRKMFYDAISNKDVKMDVPRETIQLDWNGNCLLIRKGFVITPENATEYLSEKALVSVLPFIISSVRNTSVAEIRDGGKKCYIIDRTTDWLPTEEYTKIDFSHPGLYLLRRKIENNEYAYYVGKANDISNRIVKNKNNGKVSHPDEKGEDKKQYDEIACISVKFDDFMELYGVLQDDNKTAQNNPGVKRGSNEDNALYAIEDVAIHVAAMILRGEGKRLDNKQYRSYTSEWMCNEKMQ